MAPVASKEQVDRLGELLAETGKMKKAEVVAALAEAGVDDLGDQTVGHLRATLAAVRLNQERKESADSRDVAVPPEQDDGTPNPLTEAEIVEADAVEVDESGEPVLDRELSDEVGTALALREQTPAPVSALPSVAEFNASMAVAERIANSQMVPKSMRGKPDDVFAAILFGREIGLGPMQSLRDVYMVDGRPALAAHRQLGLLRRGGVRIVESGATPERAFITAVRVDTGEQMTVEWTIEEARVAGLAGKDNWQHHPADMLFARAVGRLTRRLGPDLIGGLPAYTAEEVADFTGYGVEYGELGPEIHRPTGSTPAPGGRTVPARRTTGPEPLNPRSWAEIKAAADEYDVALGWGEWVKDAAEATYGSGKRDLAALTAEQRRELSVKAAAAIVALYAAHDPGSFPPPSREEVATAWAGVLDGVILPGPMWQMSPGEAELGIPTVYEALGIEPPSAPESPAAAGATGTSPGGQEGASGAEDASAVASEPTGDEEIPFGE